MSQGAVFLYKETFTFVSRYARTHTRQEKIQFIHTFLPLALRRNFKTEAKMLGLWPRPIRKQLAHLSPLSLTLTLLASFLSYGYVSECCFSFFIRFLSLPPSLSIYLSCFLLFSSPLLALPRFTSHSLPSPLPPFTKHYHNCIFT